MSTPKLAEAIAILGSLAADAHAQTSETLAPAPGFSVILTAEISADGRHVAAVSSTWEETVIEFDGEDQPRLGPVEFLSAITDLSVGDNGRVFATNWLDSGMQAAEWTSAGPIPFAGTDTELCGVSNSGEWVLARSGLSNTVYADGSPVRVLPPESDSIWTRGVAIAEGGSAAAGNALLAYGPSKFAAVSWRGDAVTRLPIARWSQSFANSISSDGRVIGGSVIDDEHAYYPAIWIDGAGPYQIGDRFGQVLRVRRGGRTLLLTYGGEVGLWSPWSGFRTLRDFGFAAELWQDQILSISEDASRGISRRTGNGQSVFRVLHLPPDCELDYATDGFIDFFDYAAFVACFEGDCPNDRSADFNLDGFVDFFDYLDFVQTYERGC